jgi:hypothetical protein
MAFYVFAKGERDGQTVLYSCPYRTVPLKENRAAAVASLKKLIDDKADCDGIDPEDI